MQVISIFSEEPWFFVTCAAVFGALIGSFLNVVIYRLPIMMERQWQDEMTLSTGSDADLPDERAAFNLLTPRSRCGHCGHGITALENIPVVSWLVLRGRCSACAAPISARYPLVEVATAVFFAACAWCFGATVQGLAAMVLCAVLISLTGIDLDTKLLPDVLTLPLLWLGLLLNVGGTFAQLPDAVIGAAAGYMVLWSIFWMFKLTTGREGMGYGDFKLLGALGAWFGWQALPAMLLISSIAGAIIGVIILMVQKQDRQTALAFGPYLAAAGCITLFFGAHIRQLL